MVREANYITVYTPSNVICLSALNNSKHEYAPQVLTSINVDELELLIPPNYAQK